MDDNLYFIKIGDLFVNEAVYETRGEAVKVKSLQLGIEKEAKEFSNPKVVKGIANAVGGKVLIKSNQMIVVGEDCLDALISISEYKKAYEMSMSITFTGGRYVD